MGADLIARLEDRGRLHSMRLMDIDRAEAAAALRERELAVGIARAGWDGAEEALRRAEAERDEARSRLARAVELLRSADSALHEVEAILGGDYGDQYGVLCERVLTLRAGIETMLPEREGERPAAQPTWTERPRCKNVLARCDCDAARQEGEQTQAGWISVSERLPAVNQSVALVNTGRWENVGGDWDRNIHDCGYWCGTHWCVRAERALSREAYTHWFALPAAARQEGAGR